MRYQDLAIMLFAAGFGKRMGDLTTDRPKPLVEVSGKALIDHALSWVDECALSKIVVNVHYKAEMVKAHLKNRSIAISDETDEILETGGGLKAALPLLGTNPVFAMNSDAIWKGPNPIRVLSEAWNPEKMDALLLCVPPERAIGHAGNGDFVLNSESLLTRGEGQIYSGIQIIKTDLVERMPDKAFSLNTVWDELVRRNTLFGAIYPGYWCDVGTPVGVKLAESLLEQTDV
jgi:MurNAc alpha-1-phosphate uridylyltransferase